MNFINRLKKEDSIINLSSVILLISVFLWDVKINIPIGSGISTQSKYLIIFLLLYNLILFKKSDLKYYFFCISFCMLLMFHFYLTNLSNIFDIYIIFSAFFLLIYFFALYKIQPYFSRILSKTIFFFIIFMNFIFFIEIVSGNFTLYDHIKFYNGLCVIFNKENPLVFDIFFSENSHLGITSVSVILYSVFQFNEKNNIQKINILFFILANFFLFLSLTLIIGILFTTIALVIFRLLNKNKANLYFLIPVILSLGIFLIVNNCWGRIYQVLNMEIIFLEHKNNSPAIKIQKKLSKLKKSISSNKNIDFEIKKLQDIVQKRNENQSKIVVLLKKKALTEEHILSLKTKQDVIAKLSNETKEVLKTKEKLEDIIRVTITELRSLKRDIQNIEGRNEESSLDYFLNKSVNATTIVHINHYVTAFNAVKTHPLGYGFQNYKNAANDYAKTTKLISTYTPLIRLNYNDGANNFNKLLAEFGYLNLLLVFLFITFCIKSNLTNADKIFIFGIVITQMFRGAGYFNGGFLFVIISGYLSIFIKQKKTGIFKK